MSNLVLPHDQPVYTAAGPVRVAYLALRPFVGFARTETGDCRPCRFRLEPATAGPGVWTETPVGRIATAPDAALIVDRYGRTLVGAGGDVDARALAVSRHNEGYARITRVLPDGSWCRQLLHRAVAEDVMGHDIDGLVVHHRNHVKTDSRPENLEVLSVRDHARLHYEEWVAEGIEPFKRRDKTRECERRRAPDRAPMPPPSGSARPVAADSAARFAVVPVEGSGPPPTSLLLWPVGLWSPFGRGVFAHL